MRKLDRKLLRDLSKLKTQAIAIGAVIASGIAVFVMALCAYASLKEGQHRFYRDFRFADVFATTRRCPDALLDRIRDIEGVVLAERRLVYDVQLRVANMVEPATGKLISIPPQGNSRLNQVYLARGRMVEPGRTGEAVVSEAFAEAHQLVPGDSVEAILNGRLQTLHVVGIALCPEFVMQIQSGTLLPDTERFGIFWMNEQDLEAAFDMAGAFNSVSAKLAYGANREEILDRMDDLLEPYGSTGAYGREENISHQFVNDELKQLRTMATIAPSIFLSVAAFLLNIVVSRIISQQREQIAALKAFGYSNLEVGMHYLNLVLVIALSGMVAGIGFGIWMAKNLTIMYQQFYKFPLLSLEIDPIAILLAVLITFAVTVVGTWFAVWRAVSLPPAEAMRPEPPPTFRPTWIERILPTGVMPAEFRMIVRSLQRKPVKAVASITGVALAIAVLIVGSFSLDALDYLIDFQFRKAQRQDLTVGFIEPATSSVVYELSHLRGVTVSETTRAVPARLHFQHRSKRVGITGLSPDPELFLLLDEAEQRVAVPEHGIMLNSALAGILGVELGGTVRAEILEGERPTLDLEVTAIVNEFGGTNAYMRKSQLHQLLKESEVANGAFLKVDANQQAQVYERLQLRPGVASVSIKDAAIKSFTDTIAENMLTMRSFNILFAVVIAIGVVYNSARISLSEQSRDLATMRVVGFYTREVSTILLGEITLITTLAIPVGCLIGYGLAWAMILGLATENYRIPLVVNGSTFAFSCGVVVLATLVSGIIVKRRIARLDLVSVLKTRE